MFFLLTFSYKDKKFYNKKKIKMQNYGKFSDLAAEGERLCKLGDCQSGLKYFNEAINLYDEMIDQENIESDDALKKTIGIIYNQMGNAYFYLQEYDKALIYHRNDLNVSEKLGDESGKAKACGYIGNTLQLLGEYDEAINAARKKKTYTTCRCVHFKLRLI